MWKLRNLLKNKIGTKQLICGILGVCIAVVWMWSLAVWRVSLVDMKSYETQQGIANQVFRFHVLANSDSDEDQRVKLKVRDAVISYMKAEMPEHLNTENNTVLEIPDEKNMNPGDAGGENSAQATREWAQMHLQELAEVADHVLAQEGMAYHADAQVTECYFPEKRYGDVTFPQGEYEALRITLGRAAGHNWWCVLYPNLCFLDATYAVVSDDGKEELKHVLTDEEYEMITDDKELKVKWFFFGD